MDALCLDTSVLVKLLVCEPESQLAAALVTPEAEIVAPAFAWAEVGGTLRKKARAAELEPWQADRAWDDFLSLDIRFLQRPELMSRAWQIARNFGLPTLCDAAFLAAAEQAPGGPCPFWTADASLLKAVAGRHPLARGLGRPQAEWDSKIALVAFDLDGTLVRGDTLCEAIARRLGHYEEMRAFEARSEREGVRAARREMARWYRDAEAGAIQSVLDGLELAPGAEAAFAWLRQVGVRTAIVSITWEFAVEAVARRLGADAWVGTRLLADGEVADFWPEDKAAWLAGLAEGYGLPPTRVAAVGDSAGDLPMLRWAGRAVFVGRGVAPPSAVHLPDADLMEVVAGVLRDSEAKA